MTAERDDVPARFTFSQRHGYEPLPEPMRLKEISDDLRREIANAVRSHLSDMFDERYVERVLGQFLKISEGEIDTNYNIVQDAFREIISRYEFNKVLDLLEIMFSEVHDTHILITKIGEVHDAHTLITKIGRLFDDHAAAYWLDTSRRPYRFFPRASEEQGEATRRAVETVARGGMDGASAHLRQATEHLNAGRYADSIVDSIHAVESVAREIDPESGKTLGPALKSLERAGMLKHPALKGAFDKLYNYTNAEQGLRHALLDRDAADVGLDEAMFMFGACASFAAYLTAKRRRIAERGDGA